jgi:hypothetical protein
MDILTRINGSREGYKLEIVGRNPPIEATSNSTSIQQRKLQKQGDMRREPAPSCVQSWNGSMSGCGRKYPSRSAVIGMRRGDDGATKPVAGDVKVARGAIEPAFG